MNVAEVKLGGLLARAHKTFARRLIDRFRESGEDISMEQWVLLLHLWEKDGKTQNELASCIKFDKTMVTRALNTLEAQNMVVRVHDNQDKRVNRIYLTHLGKTLKERLMAIADEVHGEACKHISENELNQFRETLLKILLNLETPDTSVSNQST